MPESKPSPLFDLDPESRALLERYRFDAPTFDRLAARLREQGLEGMDNRLGVSVEAPQSGDLVSMAEPGDDDWEALEERGSQAVRDGAFAAVVLNGGMATRFGGAVKGTVEVLPGRSFLQLAAQGVAELAARAGGEIPFLLMNSFATAGATADHLEATDNLGYPSNLLRSFEQSVSPRLTPEGDLYLGADGRASLYGPGHGDFPGALRNSGALDWLRSRGVRHVAMYNVDNLGARPHPVILGHHVESGRATTVELVRKNPGDEGGGPAHVDGHLEIVEDFRFPADFDRASVPVFNCNTFIFDLDVLARPLPLDWFAVLKRANDRDVVQFERLVGQVTAFVDAQFLVVPREGVRSRFLPVKRPADLDAVRSVVEKMYA
jgi:UTP--glucose-1-phosphate uridylyltransferase